MIKIIMEKLKCSSFATNVGNILVCGFDSPFASASSKTRI